MQSSDLRAMLFVVMLAAVSVSLGAIAAGATPSTEPAPVFFATGVSLRALDLDGNLHPLGQASTRPGALVFLGTECPISRRYVPVLNDMLAAARAKNIDLLGVISDRTVTRAAAEQFRKDFAVSFPIIFDASGELARQLKPAITPEAFVLSADGKVVYRGRIDDLYVSVARQKEQADHHELVDAINAIAGGSAINVTNAPAVGCIFESWESPAANTKITYTRNIAPILMANCASCHHAGEVAPFSLTSFEDAAKRAKQIAAVTSSKFMPPWKAEAGYGHFIDERRLTEDEIATIGAWADAGAPQGDAADLPPAMNFPTGWRLGKPDVVLSMPAPFNVPAGGRDIYRAFVLPLNIPADTYVSGFQFLAGAPSVVHHSLLFLDSTGAARKLEAANTDSAPGYATFGGVGFAPTGGLGGWAPGATPFLLPDGYGRPIRQNSDVVMQIHYHPDGKPHADQSSVAIYFTKQKVDHIVGSFPLSSRQINIAPGDAHYVKDISMTLPADVTIDGVTPHMHLLGKEMKVTATEPNGTVVPIIWIKDWDFRWQDQYRYAQALKLPKGTRIDLHAVYDNSADNPSNPNTPPKRVTFGEQTTDEMCICFLSFVANSPADLQTLRQGMVRERLLGALRGN